MASVTICSDFGAPKLERPKYGTLTTPNIGEVVKKNRTLISLVAMQNGIATLEDTLAVCYKIKHILTIEKTYSYHKIQNHTPGFYQKEFKIYPCT